MSKLKRWLTYTATFAVIVASIPFLQKAYWYVTRSSSDLTEIRQRVEPALRNDLVAAGMELGQPAFIRIFKEERELEVWLRTGQSFELFRVYNICNFSGALGPKLKEGDRQSPEGFYMVDLAAMNPNSNYHLSFNLGFPNAYDQANQRTGSFLMVHGDCVSIGCYAMTDAGIEEIYLIVEAALSSGQESVAVHAFPFRMTDERLTAEQANEWYEYWQNLKSGYDIFESLRVPPGILVSDNAYAFVPG